MCTVLKYGIGIFLMRENLQYFFLIPFSMLIIFNKLVTHSSCPTKIKLNLYYAMLLNSEIN